MITIKHGSIFDSTAQALVCPVNCVGVMGKGLALEFKRRFPYECKKYFDACKHQALCPGSVIYSKPIMFVSTKDDWKNPSKKEWVSACLIWMKPYIRLFNIDPIAIPQLGCGCGGLDWADVWPLYERHLGGLDCDVEVWVHE